MDESKEQLIKIKIKKFIKDGFSDQEIYEKLIEEKVPFEIIKQLMEKIKRETEDYNSIKKEKSIFGIMITSLTITLIIIIIAGYLMFPNFASNFKQTKDKTICENLICFENNFLYCKPSTYNEKSIGSINHYEIKGFKDKTCKVYTKIIENTNPDWINKEMICYLDNTKKFQNEIKLTNKCIGPLKILLEKQTEQETKINI